MKKYILLVFFVLSMTFLWGKAYFDFGTGFSYASGMLGNSTGLKWGGSFGGSKWILNGEISNEQAGFSEPKYIGLFVAPNLMYYPNSNIQLSFSPGYLAGWQENNTKLHYHGNIPCGNSKDKKPLDDFATKVSIAYDFGKKHGLLIGLEYFQFWSGEIYSVGAFIKYRYSKARAIMD